MTLHEIRGRWKWIKGSARQWWGKLTADEYHVILGAYEKAMGTSQAVYGRLRAKAAAKIWEWAQRYRG